MVVADRNPVAIVVVEYSLDLVFSCKQTITVTMIPMSLLTPARYPMKIPTIVPVLNRASEVDEVTLMKNSLIKDSQNIYIFCLHFIS